MPPGADERVAGGVSAIIPSMNRIEELERCLDSLAPLDVEVVVVDNGSGDGTVERLRTHHPAVRLVCNPVNVGAAEAKNQGVLAASGEFLWFLDSDTVIPGSEVIHEALHVLATRPDVGAVGGEIYPLEDGGREWRSKVLKANGETETVTHSSGYGEMLEVDYVPTCNLLMRRSLFEQIGGFDPEYFFLVEDTDLCYRLRRAGFSCVVDDHTAVLHRIVMRGRSGDLFVVHRNRVRFALLNLPTWRAAALPALDLVYLAHPYKLLSLWQGKVSATKHVPPAVRGTSRWTFPVRLGAVGLLSVSTLVAAYAWNVRRLGTTLRQRRQQPDFLASTQLPQGDPR